jgi:antitoxin component YwqK of YwqJK toxin-antitoxin module
MIRLFILLISVLCLTNWSSKAIFADSLSDDDVAIAAHVKALHDEKSEVREAAAKALRLIVAKYPSGTSDIRRNDSGEAYWTAKVNQVIPGMTKAEVVKILPPLPNSPDGMSMGSGQSHVVSYRLDSHWVVTIQYRNPDKVIERPKLSKRELLVYVAPPKNYTGEWVCWYVNGQKGHETQYKDGKYNGVLTHFHDNGHKMYEQHYVNHITDGADTGWYPDGRLSYTARYKNGKQDGKWIHYYHDGKKKHEANYKDGVQNGLYAGWYENGQMRFEMNYKNGIKHGMEAGWNEQGVVHYKREYKNGEVAE